MEVSRTLPLFPERASTMAGQVDGLFFFMIAVSVFFAVLIFVTITWFFLKYRARNANQEATSQIDSHGGLELAWTGIPLLLALVMFFWGATLFLRGATPPAGSMEIFVVGKQWMWKFQHAEGRQEINALHVPRGRPVKLTMISEDVIHDLFVPAFRVKHDVLPGRYTSLWFEATRTGDYHLFCSQYCGTQHSKMGGWVTVMEPADYAQWLNGVEPGESMAAKGGRLFQQLGCAACHQTADTQRGPALTGFFGKRVKLQSGQTIVADADYFRESVLNPDAKITAGYPPIMPTFKGMVSEEGMQQLLAYINHE